MLVRARMDFRQNRAYDFFRKMAYEKKWQKCWNHITRLTTLKKKYGRTLTLDTGLCFETELVLAAVVLARI